MNDKKLAVWTDVMRNVLRETLVVPGAKAVQGAPAWYDNAELVVRHVDTLYKYACRAYLCGAPLRDELKWKGETLCYDEETKRAQLPCAGEFIAPGRTRKTFKQYERDNRRALFVFFRGFKYAMRSLQLVGVLFTHHTKVDDLRAAMEEYARNYEFMLENFRHCRNFPKPTHQLISASIQGASDVESKGAPSVVLGQNLLGHVRHHCGHVSAPAKRK